MQTGAGDAIGALRRCALPGGVRAEWVRASVQRPHPPLDTLHRQVRPARLHPAWRRHRVPYRSASVSASSRTAPATARRQRPTRAQRLVLASVYTKAGDSAVIGPALLDDVAGPVRDTGHPRRHRARQQRRPNTAGQPGTSGTRPDPGQAWRWSAPARRHVRGRTGTGSSPDTPPRLATRHGQHLGSNGRGRRARSVAGDG